MGYVPPILVMLLFGLFSLAFALDFRGLASAAARNSIWRRGRSGRALAVNTFIQRGLGALLTLVAVAMIILMIRGLFQ